jgi:hypothetical protein
MTVHGAYTGIIRDDIGAMFTDMRMRYPGIDTSTGLYRANLTRSQAVANVSALTTEVMTSVPIYFHAGEAAEKVTFVSATTAAGSPANQWVALYDPTGNLVAQTPDLESDGWAANTAKTFTFADPVTIADSGWHRVAIMVKATTRHPRGRDAAQRGAQRGAGHGRAAPVRDVRQLADGHGSGHDRGADGDRRRAPLHRHLTL